MDVEVKLLVIEAAVSLVSTMIGFLEQTFIQYLISNKGKVKFYIKKFTIRQTIYHMDL